MASVIALALKDLLVLFRTRGALFFTFVWPIVVAVMFGFVFSGQQAQSSGPPRLRVIVVDEDNSDASRDFVSRLESSGDFTFERAARVEAEDQVRRGQRSAFVVIKPGFGESSRRMFYGEPRQLEIGSDPARAAEGSMIEGLLTKHAMQDMQKLLTEPGESRKMIGEALEEVKKSPSGGAELAPLSRFLGELDTFLKAPLPPAPGGQTTADWQPVKVTKVPVIRDPTTRRGPANAFAISFPQGVVWGIIGCVMTFAVGLVSERVRGTFVRLQTAPLSRAQVLGGKALACFLSITILEIVLFALGAFAFWRVAVVDRTTHADLRVGIGRFRRLHDDGVELRPNRTGRGRRRLGVADADGDARRRDGAAVRDAALDADARQHQPDQVGHPRDRGRRLAQLLAQRDGPALRDPARLRRGLLRRRRSRPARKFLARRS